MARGARKSEKAHEKITAALHAALATEEVHRATAAAILSLDEAGIRRLLEQLPAETAEALRPVLAATRGGSPQSTQTVPMAGKARVRQDWDELWRKWSECVFESGDEEGRYVQQEHHWEPPYLCKSSVLNDLDQIAKQMRALIARVWDDGLDPRRSFFDELRQANDEIGSGLPEWFDDGEGCEFGPHATACLLDWEWRVAQREGLDAFELVSRIRDLELSVGEWSLDDEAITAFVKALPEQEQRAIYDGIKSRSQSAEWSKVLRDAHSKWFRLNQGFAKRWDAREFAELSKANIAQDWSLALPLVSEKVRKKEHKAALALIDEAMSSMLRLGPDKRWDPKLELLVTRREFAHSLRPDKRAFALLRSWQKTAAALGDPSTAAALKVQCALGMEWHDWDRAFAAFKDAQPACTALFDEWQTTVAQESIGSAEQGDRELQLEWVRQLIWAANGDIDARALVGCLRRWLADVEATPKGFEQCKGSLATLLLDIGQDLLSKRYPKLKELLERRRYGTDVLERTRRRWLERLGGREILPELLKMFEKHIGELVPDPASAHASNYDGCAEWMAAVLELAPATYRAIIRSWQETHRRRGNLWRALRARNLPI